MPGSHDFRSRDHGTDCRFLVEPIDGEVPAGEQSRGNGEISLIGSGVCRRMAPDQGLVFVLAEHVSGIGGPPESATLLCEALVSLGMRVHLFAPHPASSPFRERLEAAGVKVTTAPVQRGSRWRFPQKCIVGALFVNAVRRRPMLVYGVGLTAQVGSLLRLPRVAPVVPWENTEALPRAKFVDRVISGRLHRAAVVIAPTETIASNVRTTYGYSGPIHLLPFWVSEPLGWRDRTCVKRTGNILYLGRYDQDKGFEYLFPAFERVLSLYPWVTLTLHGAGAVEAVRELARGNPAVRIHGPVHGEAFEEALRKCDAVVLPSVSEGYPLCLLDACARGRPIVASKVGAIPDIFEDRDCALLVPPGDVDELTRALATVLTDTEDIYEGRCADALRLFEEVSAPDRVRLRLTELHEVLRGAVGRATVEGVVQA